MVDAMAAAVCNVNDVLDGHVTLDVECLDRIYLNAYVPNLQVAGQVVVFLTQHLGHPIPSPALFTKIGNAFRAAVERFAATHEIPVVRFAKDARKQEVMRPYLEAATEPGVVAIGWPRSSRACSPATTAPPASPARPASPSPRPTGA
jgi:hypothetical protein